MVTRVAALTALLSMFLRARGPSGQSLCNGICTDTLVDKNHCGACGTHCGQGEVCDTGTCVTSTTCKGGKTDCNGSCVDELHDPLNCRQ